MAVPMDCYGDRHSDGATHFAVPMDLDGDADSNSATLVPAAGEGGEESDAAALVVTTSDGGRRFHIEDLPADVLAHILGLLRDTRAAARYSLLSSRWRNLWARVPSLFFPNEPPHDSSTVIAALAAHAARAAADIQLLDVISPYCAAADATASWLRVAGPLVSRELHFRNRSLAPVETLYMEVVEEDAEEGGAFELPCFPKATVICLHLGYLGLSLPPSRVFAALRELRLEHVQFHGQCTLDDSMMPSLEGLVIRQARGLASLTIRLKHMTRIFLSIVWGLRWLNAMVPGLKTFTVESSLITVQHRVGAVRIDAEELEVLEWKDWYWPRLVSFNKMPCLRTICAPPVYPYARPFELRYNCDSFLKLFSSIHHLELFVFFQTDLGDNKALMEGIARLLDIKKLSLSLRTVGHVYGASVLNILTMCTDIAELTIEILPSFEFQGGRPCSLNCICHQPPAVQAHNILLKFLREVNIIDFRGEKHELDFLKLLFRAAPVLRRMRVTCHHSVTGLETISEDLQSLASQSVEVICVRGELLSVTSTCSCLQ